MNKPDTPLVDSNKRLWETNSTSVAPYGKRPARNCFDLSTDSTGRNWGVGESE